MRVGGKGAKSGRVTSLHASIKSRSKPLSLQHRPRMAKVDTPPIWDDVLFVKREKGEVKKPLKLRNVHMTQDANGRKGEPVG